MADGDTVRDDRGRAIGHFDSPGPAGPAGPKGAPIVKIIPMEDHVVILPDDQKDRSDGGILIPESSRERPTRGVIVAVGPGKLATLTGVMIPTRLAVGQRVLYPRYAGNDFDSAGMEYKVLRETEVLAVLE